MTTPPPPPPGTGPGGNQPYDPSGSTPGPGPAGPPPPGMPSYGSAPGQPPQAPPPAPGGAPQGGSDKAKIMSIISIVTGVIGLCCCVLSIAAIVLGILARQEYTRRGESATLANVGLGLGIAGIVLFVISFGLQLAGVWEPYSYNFETS